MCHGSGGLAGYRASGARTGWLGSKRLPGKGRHPAAAPVERETRRHRCRSVRVSLPCSSPTGRPERMHLGGLLAGSSLHLHCRVMNLECLGKPRANVLQGLERVGGTRKNDMRRQTGLAAGDRPDVQVVHAVHTGHGADGGFHPVQVDAFGHALEQHVEAFPQQLPGLGATPTSRSPPLPTSPPKPNR